MRCPRGYHNSQLLSCSSPYSKSSVHFGYGPKGVISRIYLVIMIRTLTYLFTLMFIFVQLGGTSFVLSSITYYLKFLFDSKFSCHYLTFELFTVLFWSFLCPCFFVPSCTFIFIFLLLLFTLCHLILVQDSVILSNHLSFSLSRSFRFLIISSLIFTLSLFSVSFNTKLQFYITFLTFRCHSPFEVSTLSDRCNFSFARVGSKLRIALHILPFVGEP